MNRFLPWCLLPALLGSAVAFADEAAIREKLRSRVQVKFEETPLVEVLKNLGDHAGVSFWINREEIQGDGGSFEENVTLDLGEMQLDSALYFLLERMHGLAAYIDEDDIVVTTDSKRNERSTTVVYNVSDIVDRLQPLWDKEFRSPLFLRQALFAFPADARAPVARRLKSDQAVGEIADPYLLQRLNDLRPDIAALLFRIAGTMVDECYGCEGAHGDISLGRDTIVVRSDVRVQDQTAALLQGIKRFLSREEPPALEWALRPGYPYANDEAVRKALRRMGSFEVDDEPLEKALESLAKEAGVRMFIDQKNLERDGSTLNVNVSLRLSERPYERILSRLLHPYELDFAIEEGVLVIDSKYNISEKKYPALYDVSGIPEAQVPMTLGSYPSISSRFNRNQLMTLISSSFHIRSHDYFDGYRESAFMVSPTVMIVDHTQEKHRWLTKFLDDLRERNWMNGQPMTARLKPEFLTRVYPVFDPEAIEPSVTILKKLLVDDQVKLMEVVKDSIVIQCSDEGHIRAEAYFEAIESAHRRREERTKLATPTPIEQP